jgi:hypothetical protein
MMKSVVTMTCCAIALAVAGLWAQSGTMDKDKMDKGKMDKGMKSGTIMVTGCVADGSGGHYMLNNAMMAGDMKGQMKEDMKPMSYDLMGGNLKAHVGHKVEVTGTMASDKMMKDGKMDKGKMDKMDKDKMAGEMHGGINVKSVKMLSATCS